MHSHNTMDTHFNLARIDEILATAIKIEGKINYEKQHSQLYI